MSAYKKLTLYLTLAITPLAHAESLKYKSYKECRECHSDIFKLWSNSLHAKSYSNPSFTASYVSLILDRGKEAGKFCLQCHAPIAHLADDFDLKSPLAAEGVTCWFCHSIASVNHGARIEAYYNLDTTDLIYGPYPPTSEDGHRVIYSSLHLGADVCAGCHEYTNDQGVPILATYSEWQESPYPKNEIYCQNCHMPIMIELSAVDGMEASSYYVTAHEFRGGHSDINLAHAVEVETKVSRVGSKLDVVVLITNAESGHRLPTGIPLRKLVLTVSLKTAENIEISSAKKTYRKVLTDRYGTIIEKAPDMFLNATEVYSDNRIKPKETRVEKFVFLIPRGIDKYKIETVLNYEYTRPLFTEESVTIRMAKNVIESIDIK